MTEEKDGAEYLPALPDDDKREFRKTNEAIGLRVSEGRLSLLSRKVFNAMVFHAQEQGEPGKGMPADTPVNRKYFWIPMTDLARDTSYDSRDTELIKNTVQELQNIRIHMEDEKQWTSERLLAGVKIVKPNGLKKTGGRVYFGFTFPPEVANLVLSPQTYTRMPLYYQMLLRSNPSHSLYEICRRYSTNPGKLTAREPWEWWHSVLTGLPVGSHLPEYKYFKRDTVKPAVAEINATTDLSVELVEHRNGRKVIGMQFRVSPKEQKTLDFPPPPLVDSELIGRVVAFGIPQRTAEDLCASLDEGLVRATIKLVEERMASSKGPSLDSPAAYFRTALTKRFATAPAVAVATREAKPRIKAPAAPEGRSLRERFDSKRRDDAVAYFNEIDPADRDRLMIEFAKEADDAIRPMLKKSGLGSKVVNVAFHKWLATRLWGEPTSDDMVAFDEKNPAGR